MRRTIGKGDRLLQNLALDRDVLVNFLILLTIVGTVIFAVLFSYLQWHGQRGLGATPTVALAALQTATPFSIPTSTQIFIPPPTFTPIFTPTPEFTPTPGPKPPAARISIPAIGVDAKVVEVGWKVKTVNGMKVAIWETADNAVAHHRNSANPGEPGNVVMSGHHNIKGEVFRRLWELKAGDEIFLEATDEVRYRYVVQENLLFREEGLPLEERFAHARRYMAPTYDATLTLISCWPYESFTHRVVVIAKLAEP
ncbi:MAG: sortase [Anaerolineae bacterium]